MWLTRTAARGMLVRVRRGVYTLPDPASVPTTTAIGSPVKRRQRKRELSPERAAKVERWRQEARGRTLMQLARHWGIDGNSVRDRVRRYNIEHVVVPKGSRALSPERAAKVERWREEARERTLRQLAELWGIDPSSARERVRRHNLDYVVVHQRGPIRTAERAAKLEQWRADARERTVRQLAELWGIDYRTVRDRLRRYNIEHVVERHRGPIPAATVEQWREEARERTINQLAGLWDVPYNAARLRVRRYELEHLSGRGRSGREVEQWREEARGRTLRQLAELWGVTYNSACRRARRYELEYLPERSREGASVSLRLNDAELKALRQYMRRIETTDIRVAAMHLLREALLRRRLMQSGNEAD